MRSWHVSCMNGISSYFVRKTKMRSLLVLLTCLAHFLAFPVWANATPGGDFTLYTTQGKAVSLASMKGKVVMLYFGFTSCPEMCPTEMLQFQHVLSRLPPEKRQWVQPIFISVDPKQDTPEVLDPYVSYFGKEILALTGNEQQLREVADQYGAQFRYVPNGSSYTVDHTVNTFIIDTSGKLVRILPYGTPSEEMLRQVTKLLP